MAILYLMRGKEIIAEIDTEDRAVVALPLLGGADAFSLVNAETIKDIGLANGKTETQIFSDANLVDARGIGLEAIEL